MKVSPSRRAAFDVLYRIERERAYSSALLAQVEAPLTPADRGLCHELTLGTLRHQIYLDRIIDLLAKAPKLDLEVRISLRMALYQLYFLDKIPPYSAINESVELVRAARKKSATGFVNAILRHATRERPDVAFSDEIDRIEVETSHPRWLIEKWARDLGINTAKQIAAANNQHSESAFRLIDEAHPHVKQLVARATPSPDVEGCFRVDRDAGALTELAEQGKIYIQNEASQMVARAVGFEPKGRFLDVCAAPGGKVGLIAKNNPNARLISAGDVHDSRVKLLRRNCERQTDTVRIVQYDAAKALPFADLSLDAILVDAPCSGTGTIRSNPEIRYTLNVDDFGVLQAKQLAILRNASNLVTRGGELVYSTCSLEPEENEAVCRKFLDAHDGFESMSPRVPSRFLTAEGFARTWPHRDGMDGFFIAAFRRKT